MPTVRPDADPLEPGETDEIVSGTAPSPSPEEIAVQDARHAADHAVMAIFELAFSLESLTDAIGRFKAEAPSELREYQEAGVGINDVLSSAAAQGVGIPG